MKPNRTIGLVPQVKARAVVIGGPLDKRAYMVGVSDGKVFQPDDPDWREHGAKYRCEFLSIDGFHYHVIIHEELGITAAVGRLLAAYAP